MKIKMIEKIKKLSIQQSKYRAFVGAGLQLIKGRLTIRYATGGMMLKSNQIPLAVKVLT